MRAEPVPADGAITKPYKRYVLGLLLVVYMFNFLDRIILSTLGEAVKRDLALSDLQLGLLGGVAFAFFYSTLGVPIARLAERYSRAKIIWVSLGVWSLATAACGLAQNYWQLLFARATVGLGEGGYTPSVVSLISDYFPAGARASAYSIIVMGLPLGSLIGAAAGGWVAMEYGWRMAFVIIGLPGVALALLVALTLREPLRGYSDGRIADAKPPSMGAVLATLWEKRSFLHLTLGAALVGFVSYGMNLFLIPYLMRAHGLGLAQASSVFGLLMGAAMAVGILGGGYISDWFGRRNIRWYGWLPAILLTIAWVLYAAAYMQANWGITILLILIASPVFYGVLPATQMTCQGLVQPRMRASTSALHGLAGSLIGLGLGPLAVGWASDLFAGNAFAAGDFAALCRPGTAVGTLLSQCTAASGEGLRLSLLLMSLGLPWAALHYYMGAKRLAEDTESPQAPISA